MSGASPYTIAKELILAGKMKSLDELILIVKKTNLASAAHIGPKRLNRLLHDPGLFTIEDAHKIAALIGVTGKQILDLFDAEYISRQKSKKG